MATVPVTPEVTCPWGHPIRPDGSHVSQADLERHIWALETAHTPNFACVNSQLCIYAGAPWHPVGGRHTAPPPREEPAVNDPNHPQYRTPRWIQPGDVRHA